jgi:ribonuclease-3
MEGRVILSRLQEKIGINFSDEKILLKAITHKSYAYERGTESNERLEFLGDAVLNLVVTEFLYENFPELEEGDMSKLKSTLIGIETLYKIGKKMNIGEFLLLGKGEEKTAGREKKRLIGSAVEAIIASIYIDKGFEEVKRVIIRWIKPFLRNIRKSGQITKDWKSKLQEIIQKERRVLPEYKVVKEFGPPHNRRFKIELWIEGERLSSATGTSKKEAEQKAAKNALKKLGLLG